MQCAYKGSHILPCKHLQNCILDLLKSVQIGKISASKVQSPVGEAQDQDLCHLLELLVWQVVLVHRYMRQLIYCLGDNTALV